MHPDFRDYAIVVCSIMKPALPSVRWSRYHFVDETIKFQRNLVIASLLTNSCTRIGIQVFLIPSPCSLYHSKLKTERKEAERTFKESLLFPVRDDWSLKHAMETIKFKGFT